MPGFDADAWLEAQEPWTFRARGTTWTAHPVSAEAVVRALLELRSAAPTQQYPILRRLFRLAFPRRLSMRWRGDPVRLILALPREALDEVVTSFFAWAGITDPIRPETPPTTPSSPPKPDPTTGMAAPDATTTPSPS